MSTLRERKKGLLRSTDLSIPKLERSVRFVNYIEEKEKKEKTPSTVKQLQVEHVLQIPRCEASNLPAARVQEQELFIHNKSLCVKIDGQLMVAKLSPISE